MGSVKFSFSANKRYKKISGLLCVIVVILIISVNPVTCRKRKHPPVRAFFQGDCSHQICEQRCRDIDNGGYACECNEGYRLDHNGISCSKITKDHLSQGVDFHLDPDAPVEIRIIPKGSSSHGNEIHQSDVLLHSANPATSQTNQNQVYIHSGEGLNVDKDSSAIKSNTNDVNDINVATAGDTLTNNDPSVKNNKIILNDNKDSIHSIKIVNLDDTTKVEPLESDNFQTSESRHSEKLQNLVPNLLPQYSTSTKEVCDEYSCKNGGLCIDDGTTYRYKLRCDCPLGTRGEQCEKVQDIRYPKFHGTGYIEMPTLTDGYKELDILIEFKPASETGLLFFSAEYEDARSDFISITLVEGFVELRFDCGTGMGVVRSVYPVTMDTWNTVKVHREDNKAKLWLNQHPPVHGESQGSYSRLTLRLNLYLGGYDNLLKVKDTVGVNEGFKGCLEEVIINGYKYNLQKSGSIGDALYGMNVAECMEGLCDAGTCDNGGECKVTSADRQVCLCPLGTGGENCQHMIDVHIPEFLGTSYLALKGLGRSSLLFMEVEIVFKSSKPNGLILYNGYNLDGKGDFVSLALLDGHLEYRFDLGTGPAIIRSQSPITLNHWHWVKLSRTGMEGVLELDGQRESIGRSQGAFTQLTVTQDMYIGGHRNYMETSKHANVSVSMEGCVQKLIINKHHVHLIHDAIAGVNVDNCEHPCVGQPCQNGGQCQPTSDTYLCLCPLGYRGHNCHREITETMESYKFTTNSFLKITDNTVSKRIGGDKIDVKFYLKPDPDTRDGLLFWSGPDIMEPTSDYIALGFKSRALQFRYNLGSGEGVISYNRTRLFDGSWHKIHAQRDRQNGYLSIDDVEVVEGGSKGSYTMLNTNKVLYIGGMPDVRSGTLQKFTSGYQGCVRDLVIEGVNSQNVLSLAESGQNVVPCH